MGAAARAPSEGESQEIDTAKAAASHRRAVLWSGVGGLAERLFLSYCVALICAGELHP